jgi:hypothetical protein
VISRFAAGTEAPRAYVDVAQTRHLDVTVMICLGIVMLLASLALLLLARNAFGVGDLAMRTRWGSQAVTENECARQRKPYQLFAKACLISGLGALGYAGADFLRLR